VEATEGEEPKGDDRERLWEVGVVGAVRRQRMSPRQIQTPAG
jgi:hypothetical protein